MFLVDSVSSQIVKRLFDDLEFFSLWNQKIYIVLESIFCWEFFPLEWMRSQLWHKANKNFWKMKYIQPSWLETGMRQNHYEQ